MGGPAAATGEIGGPVGSGGVGAGAAGIKLPARIEVASLERGRKIGTSRGTFVIHRLAPEVVTGFKGSPDTGYFARPEKALLDLVYARAPQGQLVRFPELTLSESFDRELLEQWTTRIPSRRLRPVVARGITKPTGWPRRTIDRQGVGTAHSRIGTTGRPRAGR